MASSANIRQTNQTRDESQKHATVAAMTANPTFPDTRNQWELTAEGPTWSLNRERTAHWTARREHNAHWRRLIWALARQAQIPACEQIAIVAQPYGRGRLQDAGNCYPTVKAAIDGLVDAHVIPDDTPQHLVSVTLCAPQKAKVPSLTLIIYEITTALRQN